jgi:hypothetical protein
LFAAFDGFSANDQPPHGQPKNNRQAQCDPECHSDAIFAHDKGKETQMQNASSKTMAGYTNNSTLAGTAVAQIAATKVLDKLTGNMLLP